MKNAAGNAAGGRGSLVATMLDYWWEGHELWAPE